MIIPEHTIEEVRARTDIVGVVSDYVRLKKRGSNFVGLCPFHTEKTPSFNVNPGREIYKCFGCGEGGDVFSFVSRVESLSFPETVRLLAERAGIVIEEEESSEEASETDAVWQALRFAARFFFKQLTGTDSAAKAREYLENRGLTADTVRSFGIGFAPDAWDGLLDAAAAANFDTESLEKAGLIIPRKKGDGFYDRYRNRIVFPITSHVGKILGFGGRVIRSEDEPKYINSPETIVYSKSRVLYGLYQARNEIRKREEALLVEGYMDVVALHQAGLQHAVATCGTALTGEQIALLSRYASRVVLLYDADSAGVRAALKAIDLILESGVGASAVALPEGEDPDSWVQKHGPDAFDKYLKDHRQDIVHFILSNAAKAGSMETPEGIASVQRAILRSISRVPDELVRESYIKLASDAMDIPDLQLRSIMADMIRSTKRRPERPSRNPQNPVSAADRPQKDGHPSRPDSVPAESVAARPETILPAEKSLFAIMLRDGLPLVEFIMSNMSMSDFSEGTARTMAAHLVSGYETGSLDVRGLISGDHGENLRRLTAEVLTPSIEPSENWSKKKNIRVPELDGEARESALSAMTRVKLERMDETIRLHREIMYREQDNPEATRRLAEEMIALNEMKKMIQEQRFVTGADTL